MYFINEQFDIRLDGSATHQARRYTLNHGYMRKDETEQLIRKIDEILLQFWDPIGVKDAPEAADEYTSYARTIVRMLSEGRDAYAISNYLRELESGWFAVPANEERINEVVKLIVEKQR